MQQNDSRNTIVFMAIAIAMFFGYNEFVLKPQRVEAQRIAAAEKAKAGTPAGKASSAPPAINLKSRDAAKAADPRVAIVTGTVMGSVNLRGGRLDDLFLTERGPHGLRYAETMAKDSPPVELFRPEGAAHAWFAEFGWQDAARQVFAGPNTVWSVKPGSATTLTPTTPVVLTYAAPNGLQFTRTISIDEKYMFQIADTVANTGAQPVSVAPYSSVQRFGLPPAHGKTSNVHEGAIGFLSDGEKGAELRMRKYRDLKKDQTKAKAAPVLASTGGWLGVTDKYWLSALIPSQAEKINATFGVTAAQGVDIYDANYVGDFRVIAPGQTVTETTRLFAGPKVVQDLKGYKKALAIPHFDDAVDWGKLFFLTKPFFTVLEWIFSHVGNFGIAILAMTLLVRLILFPLAHKSYESMSRMKKLQKPMEELRAKYKDDPTKMQQETMALYQREKVNPMVGCLPILLQIPIFLAFYKVLSVTIEMRHAPFYGYIRDLSERDPVTVLNLFGLIPWNPATVPMIGGFLDTSLHLGPLALLYGFTMWLTTAMNPPAPDPMQQRIFQLMPIMFTFIMAGFPAGLLIYWTFSNLFSIFQQYIIMHRLKVENPIDNFIARLRGEGKATA